MYSQNGVNINFVEEINKKSNVRTYERGVENETLSCGTGAVAAVIASHINGLIESGNVNVKTKGGDIKVSYNYDLNLYKDIYLSSDVSLSFCANYNEKVISLLLLFFVFFVIFLLKK